MKLNSENFDHETLDIVSSKLSSKMETSMAIISGSVEDSFAVKMYYVLKSEYSVYFAIGRKNSYKFPLVNLEDEENLKAFLVYNKISTVLVTSEIIVGYLRQGNTSILYNAFRRFIALCAEMSIKVVFIGLRYLFRDFNDERVILGIDNDGYEDALKELITETASEKSNLVVSFSFVYGLNELMEEPDFTDYVLSDNKCVFPNKNKDIVLQPVLSDEAARYVGKNLTKAGFIAPCDIEKKPLTQWIEELKKENCVFNGGKQSDSAINKSADNVESQKDFCRTPRGRDIINHQKICAFNLIYKFSPLEKFCGHRVAEVRLELGKRLSGELSPSIICDADFVSPVPQTGLYYAMGLAQKSGIPYLQAFIKDSNAMRSFQVLDANVRKEIIKKKIFPVQELIEGKNIIVVDEAIFTGTTLKIVCKVLRECGAKKIHLAIPTPECYQQCPYYSQPRRTMLLEYVRKSALNDYFDVDSVTFQSMEGFEAELDKIGECCSYCFSKR